jgi:HSP20 family protein
MLWNQLYQTRWGPTARRELDRLQDEVNRLFSGVRPRPAEFPALNVYASADDAVVTAEVPGVDPESLDVAVEDDVLTIRGTRPEPATTDGRTWHRRERGHGDFLRSLTLPFRVESDRVEADYSRGILSVKLPRAEADKPRKIQVKTG